ncbi:hypothetical protein [Denitratisoma sp. agr-D3]
MLNTIIQFLDAIPASFWGVVVGSFFSIFGVALTNRASDKRLRAQFKHERKWKTKDREMALRKDVFLSAAEAVAAGMNCIGRFANFDIPNDQVTQPYVEKASAISKVHVIARTETILPLAQLTSRLGVMYMELFARRYELLREKNALTLIDDQVAQFEKERDRILELIKQHNIEGIADQRRWKVLQDNFDFEQKRIKEGLEHRGELAASLQPKHLEFMRECLSRTKELGVMIIPILTELRSELELPLNESAYRQAMMESYAQQQQAIDNFIQKLMPNAAHPIAP